MEALKNNHLKFMASIILVSTLTMSLAQGGLGFGLGFGFGYGLFTPNFYDNSCPQVNDVVMSVLDNAIAQDPRMAASLLRLHFHDCFVKGCEASVLLDNSPSFMSEKNAVPNANSLRGFESGGPSWELPLGRRDSTTAYFNLANTTIPAPVFNVQQLLQNFLSRGLDAVDLVSLSGGHTLGLARCTNFKKRLYNQNGNNQPDATIEMTFLNELRGVCPPSGGDNNLTPLDYATPRSFDNSYFKLILEGRGLLFSDQQLYSGNFPIVTQLVNLYAQDENLFFNDFARSMVKMGNLSPLLGNDGEIRQNCHRVNYY
ncbi:hypothetical protein KSS87_020189 [Heliosperma pusillum]|nr:hypothetical protein KSS87_020189 [Heliosperma pusillum]